MNSFKNPLPVGVHLQEVCEGGSGRRGVIVIQRDDMSGWALPGGYIETDKDISAETGAAREFREETGIIVAPGRLFASVITPNDKMLLFCRSTVPLIAPDFSQWKPTPEALAIRVLYDPEELCFPTHTHALWMWFGLKRP